MYAFLCYQKIKFYAILMMKVYRLGLKKAKKYSYSFLYKRSSVKER